MYSSGASEPQVEPGDGPMPEDRLPSSAGVATYDPFDTRLRPEQNLPSDSWHDTSPALQVTSKTFLAIASSIRRALEPRTVHGVDVL